MPTLSVVIPVHNKWELTAACLRSLAEHTPGEMCIRDSTYFVSGSTPNHLIYNCL